MLNYEPGFQSERIPPTGPSPKWAKNAVLGPKTAFLGILNKFLQISAFLTTLKYKLSHKTMVGIV